MQRSISLRIAVLFLVGLTGINLLLIPRDPWMDEAMFLVNFRDFDFARLFEPLPYYEQASPLAHYLLAIGLAEFLELPEIYAIMRGLTFAQLALVILIVPWALRNAAPAAFGFVFACLILASPVLMEQVGTTKHYISDAFATALILSAGFAYWKRPSKAGFWALVASTGLGLTLSFVSILTALAVAGTLCLEALRRHGLRQPRTLLPGAVLAVVFVGLFLAYDRAYISESAALQLSAYPVAYGEHIGGNGGLVDSLGHLLKLGYFSLSNNLYNLPANAKNIWLSRLAFIMLPLVLIAIGCRRAGASRFVAQICALTWLAVLVLNVAGALPIPYPRYFCFFQPLVLALAGLLFAEWLQGGGAGAGHCHCSRSSPSMVSPTGPFSGTTRRSPR